METLLLLNGLSRSSFLVSHGSATGREEERPSRQARFETFGNHLLKDFFCFNSLSRCCAVKEILSPRHASEGIQCNLPLNTFLCKRLSNIKGHYTHPAKCCQQKIMEQNGYCHTKAWAASLARH